MRSFDFAPLFRSTIGFDRLMQIADSATRTSDSAPGYPPYNIEKQGESSYRISMAVAGFADGELEVLLDYNTLTVTGRPTATGDQPNYVYRGIARRPFERRFELAEHIKVVGANLVNGLLHVELAREVPEALKPRRIVVGNGQSAAHEEKKAA